MKKICLLLIAFFGMMQTKAQTNSSVTEAFVKAISGADYNAAASYFDPSIKQVNASMLETGWMQITTAFGAYRSYYLPAGVEKNANPVIVGIRFENGTKGFSCNFNDKHQLVGFLLTAAPAEEGNVVKSKFREEEVSVPVKGGTLKGTILLPDNPNQFTPVALIIAGSGPTDRNGNNMSMQSNAYKLLAEALAEKGIATMRYDKRGIGASTDFKTAEAALRFDDYIQDAKSVVTYLHHAKSYQSVYIIGHSEGSLIGMIAAQAGNVSGYVSLAGAGENIGDVLQRQIHNEEATKIIQQLKKGKAVQAVPDDLQSVFRTSVQPYLISWMKYEPTTEIKKVKVPVLIIQGTTDIQVQVADAEHLKSAAPDASLTIIKGMNHVLKDAPEDRTANMETYSKPDLPVNAALVHAITLFISAK